MHAATIPPRMPAGEEPALLVRDALACENRPHRHGEGQFVLVLRGCLSGGTKTQQWLLQAGMAVWIPPWHMHWGAGEGDIELAVLYLPPDRCTRLPQDVTPLRADALISALTARLLHRPSSENVQRRARMLDLLLDEIADALPDGLVLPLPKDRRLQPIVSALLHDPSERTTLSDWAHRTGATERTLSRLFKRETGMSYKNWCHRLRLREAIRGTAVGQSNATLAQRLGFSSADSFGHWFRRQTGRTPQAFKACSAPSS